MKTIEVLGTPLLATSYDEFATQCRALITRGGTWAANMTNTQVVTMRRHDEKFRAITDAIDFFVPDGMPLVWCLNRRGAGLRDRVYGPTFMRKFLETSGGLTHYLLGGSEDVGRELRKRFPNAEVIGSFHGGCDCEGFLEGNAERDVIEKINRLGPDFIWVGLGTPKQDLWIHRHKAEIKRGVILAVGFAFDVNAGRKKDAPQWMQRYGLTWLFRLVTEPRRLLLRYLKYNTLFLYYLLTDKTEHAK
jgi:N-acetylglucosaminyldiphosphoundecaprenol N-acetyl-beta-D-mannosaminyltransferase